MRVVLHEHQRFLREALAAALVGESELAIVGVASSAVELFRCCAETRPDAALVDLDADDVVDVATRLRDDGVVPRIVGFHARATPERTSTRSAGGSLSATVSDDQGLRGILLALLPGASTSVAPPGAGPDAVLSSADGELTSREQQVMQHVAAGRGTKEIAEWLGISPKTVDKHKQNVFRKLGVQNQAHAVAVSISGGLLPAGDVNAAGSDE